MAVTSAAPTRVIPLALCAVLLAGCTGTEEPRGGPATTPTAPATTAAGITEPPPVFAPDDDILTVAIQEPSTLDPMRLQDPGGVLVARQLYEGLLSWDPVEEAVVEAAAESWDVSDGGRTFTFRLREGMTFHDGTPVTSGDFAFAFNRIARKANAADLAYALEDVQGFIQVNQLGQARNMSGLRTPNDLTLVIRLSEPFYGFPSVLTHPSLVPVPKHAVEEEGDFLSRPVGNGPFHIAEAWSPGDPVLLKSFLGFYDTPETDGLRFLIYPDAAASWLPFVNGDIDVAEVPAGEIDAALEGFGDEGFVPFLATSAYGLNLRSPQLGDIRVRRAINKAIDRETIIRTVYRGTMELPRGIVPAGMPGFQENICVDLCEFEPQAARRIVRNLKKRDRNITLELSGTPPHPRVARMIRSNLRRAGFKVKLRSYGFRRYLRRLRGGEHAMFRLGWIAEYPTPDAYLMPLFHSDSPDNHFGFSSAAVDRLLSRARATRSAGRRVQLYVQAEKTIMERLPIVPIGSFVTHWAAQPEVEGLVFDQMGGFDAAEVSLAAD